MKNPLVSIVFPNFNGGNEPLECLDSIFALNYAQNKLDVIVIDNNSSDESDQKIKKAYPKVRLIKNLNNLGFSKAINQGIKIAKGEFIFIANDDLVFAKNSLHTLINYLLKNPRVGIIGGKIFLKKNPKKVVSSGYMMNIWTGNIYPAANVNVTKEPDWIQGCALLVPKKLLLKVGLLDPEFNHFFEDFDLCLRIRRLGFKVVYLPNAIFWHGESTSANKDKSQKYYLWYRNKFRFILKNLPIINILSILLFQFFLIMPYRSLILRDERFIPFFRGILWNALNIHRTLVVRKR